MPTQKKSRTSKPPVTEIGVIGGSGIYQIEGMANVREYRIKTPFGKTSDAIIIGELKGVRVAFLPRHGRGHYINPTNLPQRANIWALKSLGVKTLIAVSAVGSLKEELAPRHFVFPSQLVDNTKGRDYTFFTDGAVAHAKFSHPFCADLSDILYKTAKKIGLTAHKGGILVCMEGPAFSTKAESDYHRKMGYDLIGMTTSPEAKLAREASMCYAPISLVTDYDSWKEDEEVHGEMVIQTVASNSANAKKLIATAIPEIAARIKKCGCNTAMKGALFTDPKIIPAKTKKNLAIILKDM
ncbi:MAG: S-methyl-5'-thioadenosine phosphorylase [Elusimicrobiaceae bacterium]